MSDGAAVALAVAASAGAWLAVPSARWPVLLLAMAGLALRRPALLVVAAAIGASALGARAEAGLVWTGSGRYDGVATLVGDPSVAWGAVRVDLRIDGRRVEAWARGPAGRQLAERLSGERVAVSGEIGPVPASARSRLASRHIAGRLSIREVGAWSTGDALSRVANGLRRILLRGTESWPEDRRGLFAGFVLGDDRGQPVEVVEDFRAAGLSHVLVVSGQNVAFFLALAGPLLRRLRLGARLAVGLGLLVLFGVLTRWEPSVLRAVAMAGLSLVAAFLGRPTSRLRLLALAVTGLVLVDPLLTRSVGFALSVGASAGIALLAGPATRALPGPRWLAEAAGVTLAAQAGVAPVLIPVFGGIPLASLPANLLAVPAAGLLMMWGMSAGLVAGLVGGPAAMLAHLPTRLLVGWTAAVARTAAGWPLGRVRAGHLCLLFGAVTVAYVASRRRAGRGAPPEDAVLGGRLASGRAVVLVLVALAVTGPLVASRWPGDKAGTDLGDGARLWRSGESVVVVVDGAGSPGRLLAELRENAVRRIDVLVVVRPGLAGGQTVAPLLRRLPPRLVLAAPGSDMADAVVPAIGTRTDVGPLAVWVDRVRPKLAVRVGARNAGAGSDAKSDLPGTQIRAEAKESGLPLGFGHAAGPGRPLLRRDHPGAGDGHPQPHARLLLRPG